jgi:hypothetical protein
MIQEFLTKGTVVVLSFLLPLYSSFLVIGSIVIFDTILTLFSNKKMKIKYDEEKFDNFFVKTIVYMLTLMVTHSVSLYFAFDNVLVIKTLTSIICIKEIQSVDRKIEILLGFSGFKFLINKLNKFIKK